MKISYPRFLILGIVSLSTILLVTACGGGLLARPENVARTGTAELTPKTLDSATEASPTQLLTSEATPSVVPSSSPTSTMISVAASTPEVVPTLSGRFPAGPKVVYTEHTYDGTVTFWAASPINPAYRLPLAKGGDPSDFGVNAALSPNGQMIAYVALPEGNYDNPLAADLWIVNLDNAKPRKIANNVYFSGPIYPLWSPDSRYAIFIRANVVEEVYENTTIWMLDVQTGIESLLVESNVSEKKFAWPLGWSNDTSGFYYLLGTDIQNFSLKEKTSTFVVSVPPFSGGWQLSPDGTRLLYDVLTDRENGRYNLVVTSLQDKKEFVATEYTQKQDHYFIYMWHPDSKSIIAGEKLGEKEIEKLTTLENTKLQIIDARSKSLTTLTLPGQYIPRSWSPDGSWLATQSGLNPGRDLYFFSRVGEKTTYLPTAGATEIIGWLLRDLPFKN